MKSERGNLDPDVVRGFGDEWSTFDQRALGADELRELFGRYFRIFPWDVLPPGAVGFDFGCGTGRWAQYVAPRVGRLHCLDASAAALAVAKRNLASFENCQFHVSSPDDLPLGDASMDFGYALGVLHHLPDPAKGLTACVKKLKPGAPFLVYVYYAFDHRPGWFRGLWRCSDLVRRAVAPLPFWCKYPITQVLAMCVYYPLARLSRVIEALGGRVDHLPLSAYRRSSFYTMRTDALDRFGTRLEHRFTADQLRAMMEQAGLRNIVFSDTEPFWCAVGYRG